MKLQIRNVIAQCLLLLLKVSLDLLIKIKHQVATSDLGWLKFEVMEHLKKYAHNFCRTITKYNY